MRGRGSIPTELREVVSILDGERLFGPPGSISADADAEAWSRKTARRDRLILRRMVAMAPIAASEFTARYSEAVAKVRRELPELFTSSELPRKKSRKRRYDTQVDQQRREKAAGQLREWIEAWITYGKSTALLMRARPDIEVALLKWWQAPKRFEWPIFPERQGAICRNCGRFFYATTPSTRPGPCCTKPAYSRTISKPDVLMFDARRPSPESIACKTFWTVLKHPAGARFTICRNCGRIFYATRLGARPRLYCPNAACGSRNSVKPYMVKAEEQKLKVARQLLPRAKDKGNWKSWILAQEAAHDAEITSRWLTRRINDKTLSLPDSLEGSR